MTAYLIRRLLQAIPTLFGVTIFTFLLIMMSPGDPVDLMTFTPGISKEQRVLMREQLCLDKSWVTQYLIWMAGDFTGDCPLRGDGILRGDFGNSFASRQPVTQMYLE